MSHYIYLNEIFQSTWYKGLAHNFPVVSALITEHWVDITI